MRTLSLRAGDFQAELCPELGGALTGLWCGGVPVLRSTPRPKSVRESACYPLVPYSNRIAQARLHWADRVWPLTPNFVPEPHAIHGTGWQTAWTVIHNTADRASLLHAHTANAHWPFPFECQHHLALDAAGLSLRLVFTNRAAHAAPCGLGWHPYFAKDASTQVQFTSASRWEMGPDMLPTVPRPHLGMNGVAADWSLDHCFSGWPGSASLRSSQLTVGVQSSLTHLVVFTRPERDFIAIEPVSHVNNALGQPRSLAEHQALGVVVLQSGESFEATLRITAQAAQAQA